jgi:tripartite-type tricarboxylate transporter receptor subunit TctC
MKRTTVFAILVAAVIASAATSPDAAYAQASQAYPNRPIKMIVSFPPGGPLDVMGRLLAQQLSARIGQVIVDNRPGAGGTIAIDQTVNAPADGYTIVMADPSGSLPANVTLYPRLTFNPLRDLAPIAIFGTTGANLVVPAQSPARTAQQLVALGKEKPGELTFASTGIGTPGHLNGELFSRLAGITTVHVPYRVVGQAVTDMVAGRISFWIAPIPTMLQNVREGQLRPLAVAGEERSTDLPGVPTMKETGIGVFDASTTYAVFAPAGTPKDIVDRLHSEIARALADQEVQDKLRKAGVSPKIGMGEDITRMLQQRIPQWADVIKSAGIKIE